MGKKEMVEELNRYFISVFTVEDNCIPELQKCQGAEARVAAITKEKVLGKLKGLKVHKIPGLDGLRSRVLQEMVKEIAEALVVIFQESMELWRVAEDRKVANVTPLFKKAERQKMGNYRPVSLTSVTEIMNKLDKGEPVDVQKAFNKELYGRLLNRITAHGVGAKKNRIVDYFVNGERLQKSEAERNLKILIRDSLKDNMPVHNYCPISLLSIIRKVMESVSNSAIKQHLLSNNLRSDAQFGLRQGHSALDLITALVQTWTKEL
eukprot:g35109.t1